MNSPSEPAPLVARLSRAARMLDCSVWSLRQKISRGELPAVKDGKIVKIPIAALEAYIESLAAAKLSPECFERRKVSEKFPDKFKGSAKGTQQRNQVSN